MAIRLCRSAYGRSVLRPRYAPHTISRQPALLEFGRNSPMPRRRIAKEGVARYARAESGRGRRQLSSWPGQAGALPHLRQAMARLASIRVHWLP